MSNNGNDGLAKREEPRAVLTLTDQGFRLAMEASSLEALYKLATTLARVGLCGVATPEEALARLLCGRELGLTAMQSMRGVHIIEGRPSLAAGLKEAICLAHPSVCEEFELVHTDDKKATYRVKRAGRQAKEYSFTIEDAQRAGLVDRGKDPKQNNWNKYPQRMLQARAKGLAADVEFGDLLFGFATREELEDERAAMRHQRDVAAATTVEGKTVDSGPNLVPDPAPSAPEVPQPVVAVAMRDFDGELAALKEEVSAASTKEKRAAVRAKIQAFVADAGGPWGEEIRAFYNLLWAPYGPKNGHEVSDAKA